MVDLGSAEEAQKLISRSILCRSVYELYAGGKEITDLHNGVKESIDQWKVFTDSSVSFKFDFVGYMGSRLKSEQVKIIESFSFMNLEGPIKMKQPDQIFSIIEEYKVIGQKPEAVPRNIWFGRFIANSDRSAMDRLDLRKRKYIGTTSFDAELALVTCNIAQLCKGKLMYDPFVGTGSFLVAGSYMGALTCGSDIDIRIIRGNGRNKNIIANFEQYNLHNMFMDVMTMDFTHNAFRGDFLFDAIVCDPPYGVREGLKVLGAKKEEKVIGKDSVMIDGQLAHLRKDYVPTKKPYEFNALLDDLLDFSASHLSPNGRLCFWMPVANDEFQKHHIPLHPDLKLISCSTQNFNKCRLYKFLQKIFNISLLRLT